MRLPWEVRRETSMLAPRRPKRRVTIKSRRARDVTFTRVDDTTIVFEGDFDFDEEDLGDYVRVEFVGGPTTGTLYTYEDPGFGLLPGDMVEVPTKYEEHNIAIVRELGRGSWTRPCASVSAVYAKQNYAPGTRIYRNV